MKSAAATLAQTCFNASGRLLDLGPRTFKATGSMTVRDLIVVLVAYGLLVLDNTFEWTAG